MRKGDFMNKSIDICTKVIYNIDNSKSPLCILRNYTRAKMQGSKTVNIPPTFSIGTTPVQKCRGLKQEVFFTGSSSWTTPVQNCRGLKHFLGVISSSSSSWTTPVQNCRGLKQHMGFINVDSRTTPVQNRRGLKPNSWHVD